MFIKSTGSCIHKLSILARRTSVSKLVLGSIYLSKNENTIVSISPLSLPSPFFLSLTELQNRGVLDIIIAAVDGLTGFPEAVSTVYPKAHVQLCIVHMARNSLKYVSFKDR